MKLTSVEIHPANSSEIAVLSFRDPKNTNPYNVKKIDGLDADDIVSRYYGNSGNSNDKFYNLSLTKREITIKIGLNPKYGDNETYSDLRDNLYKMIASSRTGKLQLQFKNLTDVVAVISGFISKFETSLFEKDQEVQLKIKPDEPMLKGPTPVDVDLTGLSPLLTTIEDDISTAPHGFKFEVAFLGNLASLTITNPFDASWSFQVTPVGGFVTGDVLHFSSEYNDKYLYMIHAGNTTYLADVITPGSVWPILFPGENIFSFANPESLAWSEISYYPTYWGV